MCAAARPGRARLGLQNSRHFLAINDVSITEGNSGTVNAVFTVSLSDQSSQEVTVDYATTQDGSTATGGAACGDNTDYVTTSGMLTFNPGEPLQQTITVPVCGDILDEPNETFFVNLSNATNATIPDSQGQGTGTIIDDDLPTVTITATDANAAEPGIDTGTFTITRTTGDITGALTVNYTVDGTATSGTDYIPIGNSVIIPAGSATATITVTPLDDTADELDETVIVTLASDTDYIVGTSSSATVTIADDDPTPCPDPITAINDLIADVQSLGLDKGTENSLLAKLNAAKIL